MPSPARITAAVLAIALCAAPAASQALTRFFVLPDTSPLPGSDSTFAGVEGAQSYSFDFAEDIRFNRTGFITLSQDPGNPLVWNVVDFRIPGSDVAIGSKAEFQRPATPGPYGTWTSSDPTGFPDFSTVNATMTGDLTATGPLAGVFTTAQTMTLSGTIVPGYYHSVIQLTGGFSGVSGGTMNLLMKKDFYPPDVTWEMAVRASLSSALPAGATTPVQVRGGFSLQRSIATPNVYSVLNLGIEVADAVPILITMLPGPNGSLTFDPGSRGLTGSIGVLVDGVPGTLAVDGVGESFTGCVLHPTMMVLDEPLGVGTLTAFHVEACVAELVPADPPINDFQIGTTTTLMMRGRPGHVYVAAASFSALPGINTGVGDIPLMPDDLLWISLDPLNPFFLNNVGIMPAAGEVPVNVWIPWDPILIGATIFMGGATFDPPTFAVLASTNSHRVTLK